MGDTASGFVTVDMRGLKTAVVDLARRRRVSVSHVVREAVSGLVDHTGPDSCPGRATPGSAPSHASDLVKIWLRLTVDELRELEDASVTAGVSRSAYVGELLQRRGEPVGSSERRRLFGALVRSNAELASMSRQLRRLVDLLARGQFEAAATYRKLLDTVDADIRNHLRLAAATRSQLPATDPTARRAQRPGAARPRRLR
jgi:hypothetical protein